MNFAISDGRTVVVTRYSLHSATEAVSLYFASGSEFALGANGEYEMLHTDRRQFCHIIASEPLTKNIKDWVPVPRNHLILVTEDSNLMVFSVD